MDLLKRANMIKFKQNILTQEGKDAMYLWKACPFPEAQELYDEIHSWK